jgi:hypothetical protein
MRRILRRRPSPATVLASIALLVALGGTGVAAVQATAPKNSVNTAAIQSNAVTAAKIAANAVTNAKIANSAVSNAKLANNAVTNSKVANNAITSAKVQAQSLLASDFAPNQLPAGPAGPAGPQGPAGPTGAQGPPGLSGVQIVTQSTDTSDIGVKSLVVSCPTGKKVIGGGAQALGDGVKNGFVVLRESNPSAAGNGWHAVAGAPLNTATTPDTWTLTVQAICATAT